MSETKPKSSELPGFNRPQEIVGPRVDLVALASAIADGDRVAAADLGRLVAGIVLNGDRRKV